ncbi:MAG: 2-oxo acid dehydrogenase subunit E2 [Actinomycetia bacterium]|nr:2-oxo acid dehydrogenase subunit E2 [Actinomycetes bacterium]
MYKVIMPKLGMTMEKGIVERWLKKEGDYVRKGESLLEIMTDKVTIEVESYHTGYLKKILAEEGEEIPVTEVIAYIGEEDEKIPEEIVRKKIAPLEVSKEEKEKVKVKVGEKEKISIKKIIEYEKEREREIRKGKEKEEEITKVKRKKILASPLAKKLAKEMSIDLSKISGTGPKGRIVKADILRVVEERKLKKEEKMDIEKESSKELITPEILKTIPLTGLRKTISERMSKSASEIPHITLFLEVDISNLEKFKNKLDKEIGEKKFSYTDFIIKATALSLEKYPILNSTLKDEKIIIFKDINIGLAVSIEDGLIVPVISNSNRLSLEEIADRRIDLVNLARENKLKLKDVTGSTFTITNLGMYQVEYFSPIINPPESGILAVGAITKKPIVNKDAKIAIKPIIKLGLALDHRVSDGVIGAKFLQYLRDILQAPDKLI